MYSEKDLFTEVCAVIDRTLAGGTPAVAAWITQQVLLEHPGLEGDDRDFYDCCAKGHVRNEVRRALRRFTPQESADVDPQLVLPGFKRLQKAYLVERQGEHQVVPTESLSDAEIEAKAVEHERMSEGNLLHADELRRYAKTRRGAA